MIKGISFAGNPQRHVSLQLSGTYKNIWRLHTSLWCRLYSRCWELWYTSCRQLAVEEAKEEVHSVPLSSATRSLWVLSGTGLGVSVSTSLPAKVSNEYSSAPELECTRTRRHLIRVLQDPSMRTIQRQQKLHEPATST